MICLILFYNKALGKQLKYTFDKELKHCNVICYQGDHYVLFEFSRKGIEYRIIDAPSLNSLIRNLRIIKELINIVVVDVKEPAINKWRPLWIRSCNEFVRFLTGLHIGISFNPRHLLNKIVRYNDKRNYSITYNWERSHGHG